MDNTLLIFFAFPIATIIISIALQKTVRCPILVAAIIFAIFLVITFAFFDIIFLVATIVYTVIAFITAVITKFICKLNKRSDLGNINTNCCNCCRCDNQEDSNDNNCNCDSTNTISASANINTTNNGRNGTFYGSFRRR